MENIVSVLSIFAAFALASKWLVRDGLFATVQGKVVAKTVGIDGVSLHRVVIRKVERNEETSNVTLIFDTDECADCSHSDGSDCLHGKGQMLDSLIKVDDWITVKIPRGWDNPRLVYQLITPRPPKVNQTWLA